MAVNLTMTFTTYNIPLVSIVKHYLPFVWSSKYKNKTNTK